MEHRLRQKRIIAVVAFLLALAAIAFYQVVPTYGASESDDMQPKPQLVSELGFVITGPGVKGNCGFQKDILYLTQEEWARLQNEKSPQIFGLGNSWMENQLYSSYDNHNGATGAYHYSIADGINVNTILDTVVQGGISQVSSYQLWSSDTYYSQMSPAITKGLKYFGPGASQGVPAADPMIAFYKTTTAVNDRADGKVPEGKAEKLSPEQAVFIYGQNSPTDDNNCHYIKKVDALYVDVPKTLVLTDNRGFVVKRLKDFMEQGIYRTSYTFEQNGSPVTHNVEGAPLTDILEEMLISSYFGPEYGKTRLEIVSKDGKKAYISKQDLDKCFVAWSFTDNQQTPAAQTGQLAVYMPGKTETEAVIYNLSKLNVVDEQGNLVTVPSPAPPEKVKAVKQSCSSIKLTWAANSCADGYTVYCYNPKTKKYEKRKNLSAGAKSYVDTGLITNTAYKYKISSYCTDNGKQYEGQLSEAASAVPILNKTAITKLSKKGKTAVALKWKKTDGASGYEIYRKAGTGSYKKAAVVKKAGQVSFTDKGMKKGKTYSYKVRPYRIADGKARYGSFCAVKKIKF